MMSSVKALLASLVDYAGLFPPAQLDLRQAMANYAQSRMAPNRWMLGRFVLPASRLNEFVALLPPCSLQQWSLSVIVGSNLQAAIAPIHSLNHDQIVVQALEFPILSPRAIEQVLPLLPAEVDAFFEVPFSPTLDVYLKVLQHPQAAAKIRTGGMTVDAFPSYVQLCQSILALAEAHVPFKATAGLHHPLPANHRLSDRCDSPSTGMQGFLNVATLAALAFQQKVSLTEALEILQERSIDQWQFAGDRLVWKNDSVTISEITTSRQQFFRSFGSCSFQDPIADLKELNLL